MKMMTIRAALMAATGAVLVSLAAGAAGAVEITVFRGSETTVVDTTAPHKGPHVLRGGMTTKAPAKPPAETVRQTVILTPVMAGSGRTIWYQTDEGLVGCWLRGTGYVGQKRILCVGAE